MDAAGSPPAPPSHPYLAEIDLERERWRELTDACRSLSRTERVAPGYFAEDGWSVKDMVAHIGTWLAEAEVQLQRLLTGTYVDEPQDVDAMNERFLAAMRDVPWETVWTQAHAARGLMLRTWYQLAERTEPADRWVRKSGAEHYGEHLDRLHEWVAELHGQSAGER